MGNVYLQQQSRLGSQLSIHEKLGHVIELLADIYPESQINTGYINNVLLPALHHGQLALFYDHNDVPVAFVIWCHLTELNLKRLQQSPHDPLHTSEWNEGKYLWLHSLYAYPNRLLSVVKLIKHQLFPEQNTAHFFYHERPVSVSLSCDKETASG